eukprot:scpid98655/ scgid34061/ 
MYAVHRLHGSTQSVITRTHAANLHLPDAATPGADSADTFRERERERTPNTACPQQIECRDEGKIRYTSSLQILSAVTTTAGLSNVKNKFISPLPEMQSFSPRATHGRKPFKLRHSFVSNLSQGKPGTMHCYKP